MAPARDRRKATALALLAGAVIVATSAASARADELRVESTQAAATTDVPTRGMTMDTVQSRFGSPAQKLAAIGNPPITRWVYPSYVVYFEYQHVIHSVSKHDAS